MTDGTEKNVRLTKLIQIGIVVRDIEKAIEGMRRIFREEPKIGVMDDPRLKYRGEPEPCKLKIAFYRFANVELEIIQPLSGRSIWQDFLDSGREGLHHIKFDTDNCEETISAMAENGASVYSEGYSIVTEGMRWVYFDTEESLSFITEISNLSELQKNSGQVASNA
jgi:hypothetical protein